MGGLNVDIGQVIINFVILLFSLSFHEAAHAWMSHKFGDDLALSLGRVSLNPVVHIDPVGTILFPLICMLSGGAFFFGWAKPTPTNPNAWLEKDKANFWVSAAGPISNIILAVGFAVILKALILVGAGHYGPPVMWEAIGSILFAGVGINVLLFVFNLIPIPPLDGSHMLETVLPYEAQRSYEQIKPYGFILLIGLMVSGLLGMVMGPIVQAVQRILL